MSCSSLAYLSAMRLCSSVNSSADVGPEEGSAGRVGSWPQSEIATSSAHTDAANSTFAPRPGSMRSVRRFVMATTTLLALLQLPQIFQRLPLAFLLSALQHLILIFK